MDINERRDALRARVRQKLSGVEPEDEELVVKESEILDSTTQGDDLVIIEESNGVLALASSLIFIGSILGIITGLLLLQGNPAELLDQSFSSDEVVDFYGVVLEAESGEAIEGVTIELIVIETGNVQNTTQTNSYGYYEFENVESKPHILRASLESYNTIERTFAPERATQTPFTLSKGNATLEEDLTLSTTGWSLENAVALSTGIALVTIAAGIVGLNAAINVRRATNYRRTQYLAGFALFSRGFIIFGPFLILCGMGLMIFARDEFQNNEVE